VIAAGDRKPQAPNPKQCRIRTHEAAFGLSLLTSAF
jgi:hypothetical protein